MAASGNEVTHADLLREINSLGVRVALLEGNMQTVRSEQAEQRKKVEALHDWANQIRGGVAVTTSGVVLLLLKTVADLILR